MGDLFSPIGEVGHFEDATSIRFGNPKFARGLRLTFLVRLLSSRQRFVKLTSPFSRELYTESDLVILLQRRTLSPARALDPLPSETPGRLQPVRPGHQDQDVVGSTGRNAKGAWVPS